MLAHPLVASWYTAPDSTISRCSAVHYNGMDLPSLQRSLALRLHQNKRGCRPKKAHLKVLPRTIAASKVAHA
jgi:hypothetical protein